MTDSTNSNFRYDIGFVGAGNMASAIIAGLLERNHKRDRIAVSAKSSETLRGVVSRFGVSASSNTDISAQCELVVLAVKPQNMRAVCTEIASSLHPQTLVVSLAAGISCDAIGSWLGPRAIVRAMPNTPCAIGEGASGLFANAQVGAEQKRLAHQLLSAVGVAEYVDDEPLIDAVTAISGSAPAYFFLFIEAMIASGTKMGLSEKTAEHLALQTAFGAAKLAQTQDQPLAELRRKVTSPNGTTEQAILSFQHNRLSDIVDHAMNACVARAKTLSEELSSNT